MTDSPALSAARAALVTNDHGGIFDAWQGLVRDAIKIAAADLRQPDFGTEANPLKLGNVEFWEDGGELIYSRPSSAWDRDAVNAMLTRVLTYPNLRRQPADERVVIYVNNRPDAKLCLSKVERDVYGRITSGHVVNGGWTLVIKDGAIGVEGRPLDRMSAPLIEITVPREISTYGDYHRAFAWAAEQPAAPKDVDDDERLSAPTAA